MAHRPLVCALPITGKAVAIAVELETPGAVVQRPLSLGAGDAARTGLARAGERGRRLGDRQAHGEVLPCGVCLGVSTLAPAPIPRFDELTGPHAGAIQAVNPWIEEKPLLVRWLWIILLFSLRNNFQRHD